MTETENPFHNEIASLKARQQGAPIGEMPASPMPNVPMRTAEPLTQLPTMQEWQAKPFARMIWSYYEIGKREEGEPVVFQVIAEGPSGELPEQTWLLREVGLRARDYMNSSGMEINLLQRWGPEAINEMEYTTPAGGAGSAGWGLYPELSKETMGVLSGDAEGLFPTILIEFQNNQTVVMVENANRLSIARLQSSFPKIVREVQLQRRQQATEAQRETSVTKVSPGTAKEFLKEQAAPGVARLEEREEELEIDLPDSVKELAEGLPRDEEEPATTADLEVTRQPETTADLEVTAEPPLRQPVKEGEQWQQQRPSKPEAKPVTGPPVIRAKPRVEKAPKV